MKRLKLFVMFVLLTISSIFSQTVFQKSINGTILKDGQPFFINGIYHVSWYSTQAQKVADMQVIGNAGFNCVHASYDDVASTTAMLNEAQSKGVYVILEGAIYGTPKQVDVSKINALKGHPALLGWNLGDDVHDNTTTTQLSAFHTQIKQLDPNHITVFTVYNKSLWNSYFGIGDYIMPYSYPIGAGDPMGWVDHQLTASRQQAILTGSSIIAIPQAYSWNGNQSGAPTAVQYRNMVYQNLINNVKGILPYTFTESGQTSNYLPSWTSLWNEVKSMNQEVNVLKNIYLNGAYTRANTGYAEGSSENVHAAYWVLNNETYIVVVNVNETGGNISASISLPQASGTLTSVFAGKPSGMTFNNTTKLLTGSVSPRDVHVYKIAAGAGGGGNTPIITARGENVSQGETKEKAYNQILTDKWTDSRKTTWIQFQFPSAIVFNAYTLTSAPNLPSRDPKSWNLQGSNNGINWTTLNSQANQSFSNRGLSRSFSFTNNLAYTYYKLNITANNGDNGFTQLAEISFSPLPQARVSNESTSLLGLSSNEVSKTINIYPNPARNQFTLNRLKEGSEIVIYSLDGKIQYRTRAIGTSQTIGIVSWPNGVYLVQIAEGKKVYTSKLVVE